MPRLIRLRAPERRALSHAPRALPRASSAPQHRFRGWNRRRPLPRRRCRDVGVREGVGGGAKCDIDVSTGDLQIAHDKSSCQTHRKPEQQFGKALTKAHLQIASLDRGGRRLAVGGTIARLGAVDPLKLCRRRTHQQRRGWPSMQKRTRGPHVGIWANDPNGT